MNRNSWKLQTSGCNFGVHYELSDCTKLPKSVVTCDSVSVNNPNCSISGFNWYKWLKTGYEISRLWGSELFCYETMGYKQGFNFLCTTCTIRTINPFCFKFLKNLFPQVPVICKQQQWLQKKTAMHHTEFVFCCVTTTTDHLAFHQL